MTQDTLAVLHVRKTSSARHLSPGICRPSPSRWNAVGVARSEQSD